MPYQPRHHPHLAGFNDDDLDLIPLTMRPWSDISKDEATFLCERILEHVLKLEAKILNNIAASKQHNPRLWEKISIYFQASDYTSYNLCDLILSPQIPNKGIFAGSEEDVASFIALCKNLYALGLSERDGEATMDEPQIHLTSPPPRPYYTMSVSQTDEDMSTSPPRHTASEEISKGASLLSSSPTKTASSTTPSLPSPTPGQLPEASARTRLATMTPSQPDVMMPSPPPPSSISPVVANKRSRKRKKEQSKDLVYDQAITTSSDTTGNFEFRSLQGEAMLDLQPVGANSSVATFYAVTPWTDAPQPDRPDATNDLPSLAKHSLMTSDTSEEIFEGKPTNPIAAITVEFFLLQNRNSLSKRDAPSDNPHVWKFAAALMGGNFARWRTIVNERETVLRKIQQEISLQAASFVARQTLRPTSDYKVICPNAHEVLRRPDAHPSFADFWTLTRNQISKWDEEISRIETSNTDVYARIAEERHTSKMKEMKEVALTQLKINFLTASTKLLSNSFGTRQRPKAPHFVFSFESRQLRPDYQEMKRALVTAGVTIKGSAHLWAIGADFLGECHPGVNAKEFVERLSHRVGEIANALGKTIYFKDNAQQDKVQIILRNVSPSTPFSQIKTVLVDYLGIKLDEILSCNWMRSSVDFIVLPSLQISLTKAPIAFVLMDYFESKRIREDPELSAKDKRLFFRVGGVSWFWEWSAGDRKYAPECHYCGCPHSNTQCPLPAHRPDLWGDEVPMEHGTPNCSEESAKSLLKLADEPIEPTMKVAKPAQQSPQATTTEAQRPATSKPSWNMVARGKPSNLTNGGPTHGSTAKITASIPGTTTKPSTNGPNLRTGAEPSQDQVPAWTQDDPTPSEAFASPRPKKHMNADPKKSVFSSRYDNLEHEEVEATLSLTEKSATHPLNSGRSKPKKKRDTNALFINEKDRTMLDLTGDNPEEDCRPPSDREANRTPTTDPSSDSSKTRQVPKVTRLPISPSSQDFSPSGSSTTPQEIHGRPVPALRNPSEHSLEACTLFETRATLDKLTSLQTKEKGNHSPPARPWNTPPPSSASATGKRTECFELERAKHAMIEPERARACDGPME